MGVTGDARLSRGEVQLSSEVVEVESLVGYLEVRNATGIVPSALATTQMTRSMYALAFSSLAKPK